MDATSPLARGTTVSADEAAAPFASTLPGGNLPWQPEAGDRRRAPSTGNTTEASDPAATAESNAETPPADLVAAFKQALAGPAPTSARTITFGPAPEGSTTFDGLAASPETIAAPPPHPESLYSQVAAAFTAPAARATSTPAVTTSVPAAPDAAPSVGQVTPGAAPTPSATAPSSAAALAPTATVSPSGAAVSSLPADGQTRARTPSAEAARPAVTGQTTTDQGARPATTAIPTTIIPAAAAAFAAPGNVTPAAPSAAPTETPVTSAVSSRPAGNGSHADTAPSGAALPSVAGQTAADQGNQPTAKATRSAVSSEVPAAFVATGNVTAATPLPAALSSRPAGNGSHADTASSNAALPSFAGQIAADRSNGPSAAATATASTSEAPAASTASGNVSVAMPAFAHEAAALIFNRSSNSAGPDSNTETVSSYTARSSFDGQAASDLRNQPTATATRSAVSSEAPAALVTTGNVTAATPAATPLPAALSSRPAGNGSNADTASSDMAVPAFVGQTAAFQSNRPAATAAGKTRSPEAVAAFAASGNVAPATLAFASGDVTPLPSTVSSQPAGTRSRAGTASSDAALPSFADQTASDQANRPSATSTRTAPSTETAAALVARGNVTPATATTAPAASSRPGSSADTASSDQALTSFADQPASDQGKPRTATATGAAPSPEAAAAFAASGNGNPAAPSAASRPTSTRPNADTAPSDAVLTSFADQPASDQGKPTTASAAAPSVPLVSNLPLRPLPAAIRPQGDRTIAAAAQPSAEALAGAANPARPAAADAASPTEESPGDAVLRSLAFQAAGPAVAPPAPAAPIEAPAPTRPTDRVAALQETIAATVSRVLVSDPLHDGGREVRIEFAADVLPETSVRLWRHEGRLNVEFTSTAAVAEAGLRDGLPRLAEAIQRQSPLAGLPEISLRLGDSAGQPGDGRSRQRYQTDEENGAEA